MISDAIQATEQGTIHGRGLVATRLIRCGEVISRVEPEATRVPCTEVACWPEERRREFEFVGFQCDADCFAIAEGIDRYMNHSCDPNTWWADSETLVACRDIQPGEEVTYDYATTEVTLDWEMTCHCGSAACRGKVTNRDHLDPAWQQRYGDHLPAHVLAAIQRAHRARDGEPAGSL